MRWDVSHCGTSRRAYRPYPEFGHLAANFAVVFTDICHGKPERAGKRNFVLSQPLDLPKSAERLRFLEIAETSAERTAAYLGLFVNKEELDQ